jgi:hypothetical protein
LVLGGWQVPNFIFFFSDYLYTFEIFYSWYDFMVEL